MKNEEKNLINQEAKHSSATNEELNGANAIEALVVLLVGAAIVASAINMWCGLFF